ncbi:hypothetical protein HC928_06120 [bacterium]|nr:hypothetical protein [bacterium]
MKNGVIYIATGKKKYIDEAIFSAKSLSKYCPNIPITIFTDYDADLGKPFESVKIISNDMNPMKLKVKCLCESPYQNTVFLDSDTEVRDSIYELFDFLDDFDMALASFPKLDRSHIPSRIIEYEQPNLFNTGVICFKQSPAQGKFFKSWFDAVLQQNSEDMWAGHFCDQHYFNELISVEKHTEFGVKIKMLPNKIYNVRPPMIAPLTRSGEIKVSKIIHCHNLHRSALARQTIRITDRLRREKEKYLGGTKALS